MAGSRELPLDHPATFKAEGGRQKLFPLEVQGRFKTRRNFFHAFLLFVMLVIPWIRIGGAPLLQIDLVHRRFYLVGHLFLSQDAPLLVFIPLFFVVLAALLTSIYGRVWCGWACPQTVFIESVFRRIEIWVEGDSVARTRLDSAPWSFRKIGLRAVKWTLFTAISVLIAHSVVAVFAGAANVHENFRTNFAIALISAIVLFDFGWFREQFCLIACPYGRFQSIFNDTQTVTVGYDQSRSKDCVDCLKCVRVCPTGVDIRRGQHQLECVGCTACIDACDGVMDRLKRPRGLIGYRSESGSTRITWGMRAWAYSAVLVALAGGLTISLWSKDSVDVTLLKTRGQPYWPVPAQSAGAPTWVANSFHAEVTSRIPSGAPVSFKLDAPVNLAHLIIPENPARLETGSVRQLPLAIEFDPSLLKDGRGTLKLILTWTENGHEMTQSEEVRLVGPL